MNSKQIFATLLLLTVSSTTSHGAVPWPVDIKALSTPSLAELASVLNSGLKAHFASVNVSVVDSPDLSKAPFNLAAPGISGKPTLLDVGSFDYLLPIVRHDKLYNVRNLAEAVNLSSQALIIGAAGLQVEQTAVGIINVKVENDTIVKQSSVAAVLDPKNSSNYLLNPIAENARIFNLLQEASLFASEGLPGKVLEISVSNRTSNVSFGEALQSVLEVNYPNQSVGLGGTFLLKKGNPLTEVVVDLTNVNYIGDTNFTSVAVVFEGVAPITSVGVVINTGFGVDVVQQHFHSISDHGVGGMFLGDTTPQIAEYQGYFSVAEQIAIIDNP